jgi:hypothetical protein
VQKQKQESSEWYLENVNRPVFKDCLGEGKSGHVGATCAAKHSHQATQHMEKHAQASHPYKKQIKEYHTSEAGVKRV